MKPFEEMDSADVVSFLAEVRGGLPERCDFCNQPTNENDLIPEEGGDWVCRTCWDRWEAEDKRRAECED